MTNPRPSWCLYFLAAAFLANFAFVTFVVIAGPAPLGIQTAFHSGRVVVRSVDPGSPSGEARLRAGDVITSVAGIEIHRRSDWELSGSLVTFGAPVQIFYERDGRVQVTSPTQTRRAWAVLDNPHRIFAIAYHIVLLGYLLIGILIAFRRPHDPQALLGAAFIASFNEVLCGPPTGIFAALRLLPLPLAVLIWIPWFFAMSLPTLLATFFCEFPRPMFHRRWLWVVWLPAPIFITGMMYIFLTVTYWPEALRHGVPAIIPVAAPAAIVYCLGGLAAGFVNYWRLHDVNERRRIRLMLCGAVVSWGVAVAMLLLPQINAESEFLQFFDTVLARTIAWVLLLAFPIMTAYAILRHRLFDLGGMIRQGLQYAAARGLLLAIVPLLSAALLLDFGVHRGQTVAQLFATRGWAYALIATMAFLAHFQRRRWLDALDRHFFRERYDANRLLRETVEELRRSANLESVAPVVVTKIETALHPEYVSLLLRRHEQTEYRALATAPPGAIAPSLRGDLKIMAILRALGSTLAFSESQSEWLRQKLPPDDRQFVSESHIDLLVPIALGERRSEALLALGPRRSEEPYSWEDKELLSSIASSLAIVLDRPAITLPEEFLRECQECGTCCDPGLSRCPRDGSALATIAVPRLLGGRYHLDRRIGRGGMGSVYAASDSELHRRVAVKLIREDLVGNAAAAERFRHEAQASAGFSHPNVVTVYDFGVAAGCRAFLVMELLEGESLRSRLSRYNAPDVRFVLEVLRGITSALDAAHRRSLVHRDLKPENIFLARVGDREVAKLLDFGLAKFLPRFNGSTAQMSSGVIVGTPRYMSPELLRGAGVDITMDLWALAVVTYEVIMGRHPFGDGSLAECHQRILAGEFTALDQYWPDAPASLKEFFAAALATNAAMRPQSAMDFLLRMESALAHMQSINVATS